MEVTYYTKAIILNRLPFAEDDTKVVVYSKDKGKLEFVARGTKKIKSKLASHLEPISMSDLMIVRGKQYDYIGSAVSQSCYINIKNDLEKLIVAGKIIDLFNKYIKPEEKDEAVFKLLDSVLALLNYKKKVIISHDLLFNFFILKLMVQLGHKPELYNCVVCKKKIFPNNHQFDLSHGGLICQNCTLPHPNPPLTKGRGKKGGVLLLISKNCIKILRFVVDNDFDKIIQLKISSKLNKEIIYMISSFNNFYYL